jgi:hypothetical protein
MYLSYDGIVFDVLFLDGWTDEFQWSSDGCDFLRHHHIIEVTVILNPGVVHGAKFPKLNDAVLRMNDRLKKDVKARLSTAVPVTQRTFGVGSLPSDQTIDETPTKVTSGAIPLSGYVTTLVKGDVLPGTDDLPTGTAALPIENSRASYPPWTEGAPGTTFMPDLSYWKQNQNEYGGGEVEANGNPSIGPVQSTDNSLAENPTSANPLPTQSYDTTPLPTPIPPPPRADAIPYIESGDVATQATQQVQNYANFVLPTSPVLGAGFAVDVIQTGAAAAKTAGQVAKAGNGLAASIKKWRDTFGITPEDIFGKLPPPAPQFPTPPPKRRPDAPPPPANAAGADTVFNTVPHTRRELEERLARPRRTLAIWLNSGPAGAPEYLLYSPYPGATSDAMHGPKCDIMFMPAIHGNVTGILKLRFETWQVPVVGLSTDDYVSSAGGKVVRRARFNWDNQIEGDAAQLFAQTPPILSNRWTMRQSPDPTSWLNQTIIEGVVHFRQDVLDSRHISADQLRPYIMPPIPFGYERQPPEVNLNSDGLSVTYRVTDLQKMMNNPGGLQYGVRASEVLQQFHYNSPVDYARAPFATTQGVFGNLGPKTKQWILDHT